MEAGSAVAIVHYDDPVAEARQGEESTADRHHAGAGIHGRGQVYGAV